MLHAHCPSHAAVLNPKFSIITRLMFGTNYSTLHYNIWDTAGNSMVIEYSGEKNLQVRSIRSIGAVQASIQTAPLKIGQTGGDQCRTVCAQRS